MKQTGSHQLLYATEVTPIVRPLLCLEAECRAEAIPSFDDMVNSAPKHYPYDKEFDQAINEPLLVLHSSGSTGK